MRTRPLPLQVGQDLIFVPGCKGKGRVMANKSMTVNIPAGIDNGQTIRLGGQGNMGYNGGSDGDLLVTISVKNHKDFIRDGFDLYLNLTIPMTVAVLGGEVTVPTLGDDVKYKIPEGTQSGTTFRLRGQGISRLNGIGKGDLLVNCAVEIPKRLNDNQRELFEQFAESMGDGAGATLGKRRKGKKK